MTEEEEEEAAVAVSSSSCFPCSHGKNNADVEPDDTMRSESDNKNGFSKILTSTRSTGSPNTATTGRQRRNIGYVIMSPNNDETTLSKTSSRDANKTAIVYFYPLSGCSAAVVNLAPIVQAKFQCHFLAVDRPGCGATSDLLQQPISMPSDDDTQEEEEEEEALPESEHFALHRIRGHVQDVLEVLQAEGIEHVYSLGVCIGHPYAVELSRQLLLLSLPPKQESSSTLNTAGAAITTKRLPTSRLHGLTLIAPFVSTACPSAWRIARLGRVVPKFIMTACVQGGMAVASTLMPHILRPSMIKKLIPPDEREEFGWTDGDFEDICQQALKLKGSCSNRAKTIEAQLGVASIWQAEVCDKFAAESGCGLVLVGDHKDATNSASASASTKPLVPVRIHASPHDKLAAPSSVEWVAQRCYGGKQIITMHEKIHSHESMTFFGGPPHNPSLLLQAAREWGLLVQ